ncbi:MAG: cell division protein ZapE [Rhodobacteraceae bacterium]|nr:cell division protein ZapE [Paracoccaceae bacterium]
MGVGAAYEAKLKSGDIRPDPAQAHVVEHLARLEAALAQVAGSGTFFRRKQGAPVEGLYLWGGVGCGKSMLMDLFFAESLEPKKQRIHFHAFMQEVQGALHEVRKTGAKDAIAPVADRIVRQTRLFCFDEMQITDIADAMIVGRLFERMFAGGVCVVTTSNRLPDDLYKNGLNRNLFVPFIDVLKAHLKVHEVASETDYRQGRLDGHKSYFTPVDEAAEMAISRVWTELVGRPGEPLVLHHKGRDVVLSEAWGGVARTTFRELCGQPLGPGDYLLIAENLRVLILQDIPRMSSSARNEAKRFVTLIDALYEARTILIVSAAAEPESLYPEGKGAFEFERTASRLREMCNPDWGADVQGIRRARGQSFLSPL